MLFLTIPLSISDNVTNVYSAVAHLCYGKYNHVDLLELCGGAGRISQVAFRRGLLSGGNVDLLTGCDLGDPRTQNCANATDWEQLRETQGPNTGERNERS